MKECEMLMTCGFFRKYRATKDLVCKGIIVKYCKGPLQDQCKRKEYRMKHGSPPPDDMLPTGHMMKAA